MATEGSLGRLLHVDGLRGIFALVVAAFHLDREVWFTGGYLAVDFFFILSGFILARVYLPRLNETGATDFIVGRIARLWPLHLATMVLYVVGYNAGRALAGLDRRILPDWQDDSLSSGIDNALLIHNVLPQKGLSWNYPSWSISVELFVNVFFVIVLLMLIASKNRNRVIAATGLFVAICYTSLATQLPDFSARAAILEPMGGITNTGMVRGFAGIFYGLLIHELVQASRRRSGRERTAAGFALKSVAEVAMFALLFYTIIWRHHTRLEFTTVLVFGLLLATLGDGSSSPLARVLGNRVLTFLGTISYGVYLGHVPLHQIFKRWDSIVGSQWSDGALLVAFLTAVIALATVLHFVIEKPAQVAIRRWWRTRAIVTST